MVPIGRDGEGPVIYQARDHVWCESNDHGLCWEENNKASFKFFIAVFNMSELLFSSSWLKKTLSVQYI
jgi:hypothetical protein